jgi:hypothetical protein
MKPFVKRYIRDEKNNPRGVVVFVKDGDKELFGYSLCNPSDKFDKKLGTTIALARATCPKLKEGEHLVPIVGDRRDLILDYYKAVEENASKYSRQ